MSVRIYKIGGSGATTGVLKGVHSVVNLEGGQASSQCIHSSNLTTFTCTNNLVVCAPYIPNQTFKADSFSLFVNTAQAGKNARVMVYSDTNISGNAGLPDLLLLETADMSLSATGKVTSNTSLKFDFTAGTTYWIAVTNSSTTAVLSAIPVGNLLCIANKTTDGTPLSVYTGSGNFTSGALDPFSDYTSKDYGITAMPMVLINLS
jgi:hypothetical protein